jgi:hypothetical protein
MIVPLTPTSCPGLTRASPARRPCDASEIAGSSPAMTWSVGVDWIAASARAGVGGFRREMKDAKDPATGELVTTWEIAR